MKERGVAAPSAITQALVEAQDGEEPIGTGFFGKYLKKHADLKKKAEDEVAAEAKRKQEAKERMKEMMAEKIKADPVFSSSTSAPLPKKKKKTLSERAGEKLAEQEAKKKK